MTKYAGYSFTALPTSAGPPPHTLPATVRGVEAQFAALRPAGEFLAAHVNGRIRPKRYTHMNYGRGRAKIHFQGLQRTRDGLHAFVSGGDSLEPAAHLFTLKMASRAPAGAWRSNVPRGGRAPAEDGVIGVVALSRKHWHAGGMGLLGDVLVVPLEADDEPSRTVFLDVSDPAAPAHIAGLDIRGTTRAAGAAALTRLPNGFFLCAVYRDEQLDPPGFIDFHLSVSTDLSDGFQPSSLTWWYREAVNVTRGAVAYQNIALLLDAAAPDDPAARLYLLAMHNTAAGAPVQEGDNIADLFRVDLDAAMTDAHPALSGVTITHVAGRTFNSAFGWGNFAAMGGVHVDSRGRLSLYAGAHWRPNDLINFTEFRTEIATDTIDNDEPGS